MFNFDPWDAVGFLFLFAIALLAVVGLGRLVWTVISAALYDRRMRRAHLGKVVCDEDGCKKKAIKTTPLGLYCGDHWAKNHRKPLELGGSVAWSYTLNYAKVSSRDD